MTNSFDASCEDESVDRFERKILDRELIFSWEVGNGYRFDLSCGHWVFEFVAKGQTVQSTQCRRCRYESLVVDQLSKEPIRVVSPLLESSAVKLAQLQNVDDLES